MNNFQAGVLAPVPLAARHLFFALADSGDVRASIKAIADLADGEATVVGIGRSVVKALGATIDGLRSFPQFEGAHADVPSTPFALWAWLRGDDRGELIRRSMQLERVVAPYLALAQAIDAFRYGVGRDLTGFEDGTENPQDAAAIGAAIVAGPGALDGSSFVAIQQWAHAFDRFEAMAPPERDLAIGRRLADNEEIDDAPAYAHVKRTAQESFEPEAFVLRRSMPWNDERRAGLVFVAFGKSFDAFEAQLRRMTGAEDGVVDALFRFSRPLTGAYFWCPPCRDGKLDLRALGL